MIFAGNTRRYRFQALKARSRLKIGALFAAMQRRVALGAGSFEIDARRKRGRAVIAARRCHGLHQAREAGACHVDRRPRPLGTRPVVAPFIGVAAAIMIAAIVAAFVVAVLFVLSFGVHKT